MQNVGYSLNKKHIRIGGSIDGRIDGRFSYICSASLHTYRLKTIRIQLICTK